MKRILSVVYLAVLLWLAVSWVTPAHADTTYTVQFGDTLSLIAFRFGVTVGAIADANGMDNINFIRVGQVLKIPGVAGPVAGRESGPAPISLTPPPGGQTYVIQPNDSLSGIAVRFGTTVQALADLNKISPPYIIITGRTLLIPAGARQGVAVPAVPAATPPPAPTPGVPAAVNLLLDPSFEGNWYYVNGVSELQIPEGWSVWADEGPNTLTPGDGGLFLRPECRVVPYYDLPAAEQSLFIFEGLKTIKCFKGGGPTSFAIFTDVILPAGTYRFTTNFFADVVSVYNGSQKIWANIPESAETRIIHNNSGSGWSNAPIGTRGNLSYTFSLTHTETVRLGGAFRNRYVNANNGWFLDNWSLVRQ